MGFLNLKYELNLPWPPSVNHCWLHLNWRNSRSVILTKNGKLFRALVERLIREKRDNGKIPEQPLDGALEVKMKLYPPDKRRRDIDNYSKAVFDALTHGGFWKDDSQVVRQIIEKHNPVRGGKVEIYVTGTQFFLE